MPDQLDTVVDDAIREMQAQLDSLPAKIEGLTDYASMDLLPATKESVVATTQLYQRRVEKLTGAIRECTLLLEDGYPTLPTQEIPQDQFLDLEANRDSIELALELFAPTKAVSLGLTVGPPENK